MRIHGDEPMPIGRHSNPSRTFRSYRCCLLRLRIVDPGTYWATSFIARKENPLVIGEPFHAVDVEAIDLRKLRLPGPSGKQHQRGAIEFVVDARHPLAIRRESWPIPIAQLYGGRPIRLSQIDSGIPPLPVGKLHKYQRMAIIREFVNERRVEPTQIPLRFAARRHIKNSEA